MAAFHLNAFNIVIVVFVALGSTACSYGMATISSAIGQASFYTQFNLAQAGEPGYNHTASILSAMTGLSMAGAAFGAGFTSWAADYFGRKKSIQIGALWLILGGGLCAGSINIGMFLPARFIAGFGIGMLITSIPMYQAEVATPESRGFLVSMHGIMFAMGYTLSAWIGFGCYFYTPENSTSSFAWRFPLAFQTFPAIILLIGSPWLPLSPRWLLQQNREGEAHGILKRLHGGSGANQDAVEKQFYQMKKQLELDRSIHSSTSRFAVFATGPNRRRALVGFLLMFGNQLTGVYVISSYGVLLYISLGLKGYWPLLLSAIWVTLTFPGNIFTAFYVDKFGRRKFLLTGLAGTTLTLICECVLQALYLGTDNSAGQGAAVFFIFVDIIFWSFCIDATQYLYLSEIFPTHIRSQGMAVGMVGNYTALIIMLVAGPIALNNITWKFFLVLTMVTACQFLVTYFLFPETKQRSLDDINQAFGEKVAVHYYGATQEENDEYDNAIHGADIREAHLGNGDGKEQNSVHMVEDIDPQQDLRAAQ